MSPELERQPESVQFRAELESILDVPLTPENIDNYADNALGELVELVQSVQAAFQLATRESFAQKSELENAAFHYYNLEDIEEVLDYVADKADEIHALDILISNAPAKQSVFVPSDSGELVPPGEDPESYEPPRTTPRIKTLLFVLANEFQLDVHDETDVTITTGMNAANMLRGESYTLVDIPSLERCVLVCDEVGNVTFVFDRAAIEEIDVTPDDITALSKSEIKDLLRDHPALGQTLRYYENTYVSNLFNLLNDELEATPTTHDSSTSYLRPDDKNPEGVLSINGLAKKWGVRHQVVASAIEELSDELGQVEQFTSGAGSANVLKADQQAKLYEHLEDKGMFADKAPEGVFSANSLAKKWGISGRVIADAIDKLSDELGEVEIFRFGARVAGGYTPEQQAVLRERLQTSGAFIEKPPENVLSILGLTRELSVAHVTVENAIEELDDALGEVAQYKFGSTITGGYTPEQQALIRKLLREKGALAKKAPESVSSVYGLAKKWGVSSKTVASALEDLGDELCELEQYKFGPTLAIGLNTDQQDIIREYLEKIDVFTDKAPESVHSINGLAKKWSVSHAIVANATTELSNDLGEIRSYNFSNNYAHGFDEQQQAKIREYLEEAGLLAKKAPEDVHSVYGLARGFAVSEATVTRAIEEIGDELGHVEQYKFGPKTTTGFTPNQQAIIRNYLKAEGMFADKAPEKVLSGKGLADNLGVSDGTVASVIQEISEELGEVGQYKFGSRTAAGYTPKQQAMIHASLEARGVLAEKAPEGVLSVNGLARKLGVGNSTIAKIIEELDDQLGEVGQYKFGSRTYKGFTPNQQAIICERLEIKS